MTTSAPVSLSAPPDLSGSFADAAANLSGYAAAGEDLLASLPAPAERDAEQRTCAATVLRSLRAARREFLSWHVETVYDLVTERRSRYRRLSELVYAAADLLPGLLPTRKQMSEEQARLQAHREGREIDQSLFCGAVLRSATAGRHLIDAMLLPTSRALELREEFRDRGRIELERVSVERRGSAAHVTFRDAHCLNAEDNRLIADLETAIDLVLLDGDTRVGVLRGGPVDHPRYQGRRVFSAGINLKELRNGGISFVDFLLTRELGYINKMYRGLLVDPRLDAWTERTVQKPWIGAVDSFAIGGGMQLLLVLDRVIAETDAFLSLPAAEEGIVPGLANLRLTRAAGARLARQVILGGLRIPADSPEGRLLCDETVPADGIDAAIAKAVEELGAPAVAANRAMLNLAEEPLDLFREYLAEFAVAQAARAYSDDVLGKVERRWQQSGSRR